MDLLYDDAKLLLDEWKVLLIQECRFSWYVASCNSNIAACCNVVDSMGGESYF